MKLFDFDKLLDSLTGFLETKIELIKLDIESEVQKVLAKALIMMFVGLSVALAIFMLSIGVSQLLNDLLDSEYLGFGIVALLYLTIGLVVYLRKDKLMKAVLESIADKDEE